MTNPITTLINRWQAKRRAKKEEQAKIAAAWEYKGIAVAEYHSGDKMNGSVYVNDITKCAYVDGLKGWDGYPERRYIDYQAFSCGKDIVFLS